MKSKSMFNFVEYMQKNSSEEGEKKNQFNERPQKVKDRKEAL
jgi:hypothetical protein